MLSADKDKLKLAINCLVGNAIGVAPSGGKVTVLAVDRGNVVDISVEDTGTGIPPESMDRVFDWHGYGSVDYAGGPFAGTGVQLMFVKYLVELHCGEISVQSEPGRGSRFTVTLPVWQ